MCGRFTIVTEQDYLEDRFGARFERAFKPVYNAAPAQLLPVVTSQRPDAILQLRWGMRPVWWQKLGRRRDGLINVRDDNLRTKRTFAADFQQRRCLVLADGFFEWDQTKSKKIPYRILLKNERPFALAGIWEENVDHKTGEIVPSFSIVTTASNSLVGRIHDRMPVILAENEERDWLKSSDRTELFKLLNPYPAGKMKMYIISSLVNNPKHNSPDILKESFNNNI